MTVEIKGTVESPLGHVEVAQKRVLVQGWAYASDGGDVAISAVLDGGNSVRGKWGLARFDVFKSEKNEYAYESGFYVELKLPETFDQKMEVEIFAGPADNTISLGKFSITRSQSRSAVKKAISDANKHKFKFVPAGPVGSVRQTRKTVLETIQQRGRLQPTDSVLEIGPGIGRFALPVTQYLQPSGRFRGLDILPQAVEYCNYHIGSRYKNFEVKLVDVINRMYNKTGSVTAENYKLPFDDNEFDVIYLQSVFTHMMFPDVANYINEISRILKPGGHCIATYFLIDDDSKKRIESGSANRSFRFREGESYADVKEKPEAAIAFEESLVRNTYVDCGLEIVEPIDHGSWRGNKTKTSQDTVVCRKPG